MRRYFALSYGIINYIVAVAIIAYNAAWLGGFVPYTVNSGPKESFSDALMINTVLILILAVQHTVQARTWFKSLFNRVFNKAVERSTYVFGTNLVFLLIFWQWRTTEGWVWQIDSPIGSAIIWILFFLGWILAFTAILIKNHFHFLGVRQTIRYFQRKDIQHENLKKSFLYSIVRHPMYLGFLLGYWAIPNMSIAHFEFATLMTIYTIIGIKFEERLLIHYIGDSYKEYQRQVPALIPLLKFKCKQ
jgi:protein-S-isoprenylcysteine O-methyltransferase Ste14